MRRTHIFGSILAGILLGIVDVTDAQGGQPTGGGQCMQRFDQQLSPNCFDPRGLNFQGVLFLITQNVTGRLPDGETVQSYTQKVCRPEDVDNVIPCVLQLKSQYTNTTCAADEVTMIDTSATQLTIIIDQMCMRPCERMAVQTMSQCFASAQVNPNRWVNTTMTADKFSIMGNTTEDLNRFCGSRDQVFTCLRQIGQVCPTALPRLHEMGIDIAAMEVASLLVCQQRETYLAASRCFFTPNPAIGTCSQETEARLAEVVRGRFISGLVKPSDFLKRLCGVKLNLIICELKAFSQTCAPEHTSLRNKVECSIIPTYCRRVPEFQAGIQRLCPEQPDTPPVLTRPGTRTTTPKQDIVTKHIDLEGKGGAGALKPIGGVVVVTLLFVLALE